MEKNPPSKIDAETQKICEAQDKRLEEMQDKVNKMEGGSGENLQEKINKAVADKLGHEPLTPRETKELIRQVPQMSEAEKEELRQKLKMENDAYHEAINKELKEKLEKADKKATKSAQELKELQENGGSPAQVKAALDRAKEADKNAHQIRIE